MKSSGTDSMLNTIDNSRQVIRDIYIVTCNEQNDVLFGDMVIQNGIISEICEKPAPADSSRCRVATPAFHNLHMHLGETIFRGRCDGMDLFEYLDVSHDSYENEVWKRNEGRIHRISGLISFIESIKSGCGIFACSRGIEEAEEMGIKSLCLFPLVNITKLKDYYQNEDALQKIEVGEARQRVRQSLFVQSLYLSDEEKIDAVARAMENNKDLKLFIHVAETQKEMQYVAEKYNMSPIEFLHSKGLLGRRTFCVHCVHLSGHDIQLLKETATNVILCPISNMKLRSGFPDIKRLRENGINLLVSPDGFATNNSASLLEELKLIALNDYEAKPEEMLKYLTVNPAKVLCDEKDEAVAGQLVQGAKADIAVFDTMAYLCMDKSKIASNMIFDFPAFECSSLYVDGEAIYEDREIKRVSEDKVTEEFIKLQQEVFYG